jgi:hypothetical protein
MTVGRDKFLVNKTNRHNKWQFYCYYNLHVSGSLSAHHQEFLVVHRHWYILCSFDDHFLTEAGWNAVRIWSSKLHKMYQCLCKTKNSWWWAERLPQTRRSIIPINLEFSVSVGFIYKEFVSNSSNPQAGGLNGTLILLVHGQISKWTMQCITETNLLD